MIIARPSKSMTVSPQSSRFDVEASGRMGCDIVAGATPSRRSISASVTRPRPYPRHVIISAAVEPLAELEEVVVEP
jgi:hypothetical protein